MTPQQYGRLTELFNAAIELAPDQRAAFLDGVCHSDVNLRRELESLLRAREEGPLTEKPPDDIAAGLCFALRDHSDPAGPLPPKARVGRYEIRSLIGKGGMGDVYLAEDITLRRLIALKLLPASAAANQDRLRRFVQEAKAAGALSHPHIAQIFEVGEHNGTHFIAMELIEGVTLRAKIHQEHADLRKLLKYLQQVADGLAKAHTAGIVHRDLKPDNIMITFDDYAKILDFGLAKLIEPQRLLGVESDAPSDAGTAIVAQQSLTGMVMGTAGYMSPEQAEGRVKEIDQRSDIFSFGCILFESVTGQRAFAAESVIKSLHKIIYEPAPAIKDCNPAAPPELQRVIRRCLAKDPDQRYQSIKDVALDLKEVRQGMAGSAYVDTAIPLSGSLKPSGQQTAEQLTRSTSSAEYIATEIKRHQKSVAIIFTVLVAGFSYGLYKYAGQKQPAPTAPAIKMTRLTSSGKVSTGVISPDGKHVVYVVEDVGQESIWLKQVATSSNVQIAPPSKATYANLSFTHDGNYIYFNKRENSDDSIYRMSAFGGLARKIVPNLTARVALSFDDKHIAFIRGGFFEGENSLIVANSDGSGERVLATHKAPLNFYFDGVAWAPDGKSITCVSGPYARRIIEVPLDGGEERPVQTPKWFSIINIEWFADGSGLNVAAKEPSQSSSLQLWHLAYPSGEARRITNNLDNYAHLSLTADASSLVVIKRETTANIWLAPNGDSTRARQLTTGTSRKDGNPALSWTPDGRIVFDSTASGSVHTWIMNSDGSGQRQLNDGPYEDQGAHVSPDGH
ncbi:MAG TPA: protein kinase, partial [Pyrinomonadaceae bacterium]|nr:protein kinase [Pyrinomonadaceae bacterium]